jgi:hypothetical protein
MVYQSRPTLGATRARQGRFGRHMIWVLLFGTLLAAIGLFAAWTWKAPDLASSEAANDRKVADSRAFNAPDPAPLANPAPAAPASPQ